MTAHKFVIFTALALGLITLAKLFFILFLDINNTFIVYTLWIAVALITIACSRRLGIMTYLESFFVTGLWLILSLFFDLLVISTIAGDDIYKHLYLWIAYAVMVAMIFLFHKKRHVEVRKLQQARQASAKHH